MNSPGANFDRVARPYRMLEYLTMGRALERTRFYFLDRLSHTRNALVFGDGDGRFLERLLHTNPLVRATAVDRSGEMLRLLRMRCQPCADRLQSIQGDALSFAGTNEQRYDLIVTHFFLDCLRQDELVSVVERVRPLLDPGTTWVLSEFRIPSGAMRLPAKALVGALYLIFRILTGMQTKQLPDYASTLKQAGFTRVEQRLFLAGVLTAEIWQYSPEE